VRFIKKVLEALSQPFALEFTPILEVHCLQVLQKRFWAQQIITIKAVAYSFILKILIFKKIIWSKLQAKVDVSYISKEYIHNA